MLPQWRLRRGNISHRNSSEAIAGIFGCHCIVVMSARAHSYQHIATVSMRIRDSIATASLRKFVMGEDPKRGFKTYKILIENAQVWSLTLNITLCYKIGIHYRKFNENRLSNQ